MKKLVIVFTSLSLGLLFTACPYESMVPIDNGGIKINSNLLGNWQEANSNSTNKGVFKFSKRDENSYSIEMYSKDTSKFVGHFSEINSELFLNSSYTKEDGKKVFYIHRLFITNENKLIIFPVSDVKLKTIKITDSKQLKEYIAKNKSSDGFYEDPIIMERMK